jgi:hypothetical protein
VVEINVGFNRGDATGAQRCAAGKLVMRFIYESLGKISGDENLGVYNFFVLRACASGGAAYLFFCLIIMIIFD